MDRGASLSIGRIKRGTDNPQLETVVTVDSKRPITRGWNVQDPHCLDHKIIVVDTAGHARIGRVGTIVTAAPRVLEIHGRDSLSEDGRLIRRRTEDRLGDRQIGNGHIGFVIRDRETGDKVGKSQSHRAVLPGGIVETRQRPGSRQRRVGWHQVAGFDAGRDELRLFDVLAYPIRNIVFLAGKTRAILVNDISQLVEKTKVLTRIATKLEIRVQFRSHQVITRGKNDTEFARAECE